MQPTTNISNEHIKKLQQAQLRITPARKELLTALSAATTPLTPLAIASVTDVDTATVYRNLEPLVAAGILEAITVSPTETRYALSHHHHDHVVCDECGLIEHVACAAPKAPRDSSFPTITHHVVTYYGLCATCASSSVS